MHMTMTDRQKELVDLAGWLGREKFAARAADYDREARFPFENYDDLREHGFLALCIPQQYGGLGADYQTYMLVAAEIGRHCGATALTFNMHSCSMLWSGPLADDLEMTTEQRDRHEERRAGIFRRVVEDKALFAQPFSEPNTSAAAGKAPFGTTARKTDGGWLVNGKKHFASLSGAANYYGVLCTEDREGADLDAKDTLYLAVPGDAAGFEITGTWDTLGMRATVSRSLNMQDVFVPDELQIMPRGIYYKAALTWPHMFMTLTPSYMGIAHAAYDFVVRYLRGEVKGGPPGKRRSSPTKQMFVAEMKIKLEQAEALFLRAIAEAKVNPTKQERMRAYAAQYTIMEYANDICQLAIRTCGGSTIMKALPLERLYRDSRCGALMLPWTAEACLERIGREALYEPGERDD